VDACRLRFFEQLGGCAPPESGGPLDDTPPPRDAMTITEVGATRTRAVEGVDSTTTSLPFTVEVKGTSSSSSVASSSPWSLLSSDSSVFSRVVRGERRSFSRLRYS
jgi:hypothetical protein